MPQEISSENLFVSSHPLILHKLSLMRDKSCDTQDFRMLLREIGRLMAYEVTKDLSLTKKQIETLVMPMDAPVLADAPPVIVPVLRAGLGMADGVIDILTDSPLGHIGLYRDEKTHKPVEYLVKLPPYQGGLFIIVDPMLATGHSAAYAYDCVIRHGVPPNHIVLLSLVAAPEGVKTVTGRHPAVKIFTAALDERLNEKAYIVPGLGDAGDRLFGT